MKGIRPANIIAAALFAGAFPLDLEAEPLRASSIIAPGRNPASLSYAPAPPDNPLKGFVRYLGEDQTFPHSLEWDYTALSEVMSGPNTFSWKTFDAKLDSAAARGHQFIARFYLEFPGRPTGVPKYLLDGGLRMGERTNIGKPEVSTRKSLTPDYEDPNLRVALTNFIYALGRRYDGDPRLGFMQLGLLGAWGEWHNHPKEHLFASKTVQREVMDAFEAVFTKTKLLARYPEGANSQTLAANNHRALGYHDDSFAYATVHTGKKEEAWFFETRLRNAGVLDKWRTQPIGGEVRPAVWPCLFSEPSCAPPGQEFDRCLGVTHVSWLCNSGVFGGRVRGADRDRALDAARRLGYELQVVSAEITVTGAQLAVSLAITNRGVAPFYYDWPVELAMQDELGNLAATWKTDWRLSGVQPGEPAAVWRFETGMAAFQGGGYRLLLHVRNPLPAGPPLRFGNQTQDQHLPGWLTLGEFKR